MSAYKFGDNINLQGNQIFNLALENLATAPASPVGGRVYYDTALLSAYFWNGSAWVPMDARKFSNALPLSALVNIANGTMLGNNAGSAGAPLALTAAQVKTLLNIVPSDVSGFDTQVRTSRLDQMAAPTGAVSLNSKNITNLADPTTAQMAATKNYVDTQVQQAASGIDPKESCRVASTANIATLSGLLTIDGVTVAAGDRVLVKNQTTASANGIYVASSGAWARSTDGAQGELTSGALVFVTGGTSQAATQWYLQTADPITIGTTALSWTQFGAGNSYTADATGGLQLVGSAFSAKLPAGSGLVTDASGIYVDPAIVARKYSTTIGDGSSVAIVVTHNLNTQDIHVTLRNSASPYDLQFTTVEATSVNTCTLRFATAPASNSLRVTVIG